MRELLNITRALGDENRIRALFALRNQELCVCQLIELLELAPSTVSKHMTILKQAGLVEGRKEGRWIYYSLPKSEDSSVASEVIEWAFKHYSTGGKIREDKKNLKLIVKFDPEEVCRRQRKKESSSKRSSLIKAD